MTVTAPDLIESAKLAVVKVGSALITDTDHFTMGGLAGDIKERPWHAVLVSSGAVAVGNERVPTLDPKQTEDRHALSAIGQATLITMWQSAFDAYNKVAAQVLLTPDVTDDRSRYLNARAALRALFDNGVIPIVNENDAVTTRDFRYGDNDRLAAKTAGLIGADLLIILSDVDGLYTSNPSKDPDAKHVSYVPYGEASRYFEAAEDTKSGGVGTGGMRSKLAAARIAIDWGVTTIIASGRRPHPLRDLVTGEARCTIFEAGDKISARRRWLSGVHERSGSMDIDAGALKALKAEASLLACGVVQVAEPFLKGDVIDIRHDNQVVGFGLAACDSASIGSAEGSTIVLRRDDLILTEHDHDRNDQ
ncbi:gamma-glutamyl kinase [Parvularcula bermudensis HTCC2503]|uniref:Glutamate 5-kinase n=1 Tax=Parvularcula bermudensis (strain ATCC BAA-594 / HTCC2503 / KCTC 12087) TaxID=314260 RepID=E0TE16_PARBH|nr:glutamate 5-kinase [Parvularcula bermudensis]ADM08837.1 gamma-glutamyl kinase [Parvularcula bermudensis HTCC2503]